MCGRAYSTYTDDEIQMRYKNRAPLKIPELKPNFNFSPTQQGLILHAGESGFDLELAHWGIIPPWEPEFKTKLSTINAKAETLFSSRLYASAAKSRRCVVPLSGFIEWKREGDGPKRPFKIFHKNQPILSVAGIWDAWKPGTPEERHSFSIITTVPNEVMKGIHNRMPVILGPHEEDAWLDPSNSSPEKLLRPCPDEWLGTSEISTLINSPRNNRVELLSPI